MNYVFVYKQIYINITSADDNMNQAVEYSLQEALIKTLVTNYDQFIALISAQEVAILSE